MNTQNNENIAIWTRIYAEELIDAVLKHPEEYTIAMSEVPGVTERMTRALVNGTGNKEGRAIKATCRRLRIAHTYKAIKTYLCGASSSTTIAERQQIVSKAIVAMFGPSGGNQ